MKLRLSALLLSIFSVGVNADEQSNGWNFRIGAAQVSPNDKSGPVLGGDGVSVDSGIALGFSLEFPLNDQWGLEVLAATPFSHDIKGTGALTGLPIGEVKHLPPTVTALYYLDQKRSYHLGIGLNYTTFFEDKTDPQLTAALGATSTDLELSDSFGLAVKFGFDIPINDTWNFNGNFYYMNIESDADVFVDGVLATTVDVTIDPVVIMLGLSTRF